MVEYLDVIVTKERPKIVYDLEIDNLEIDISSILEGFLKPTKEEETEKDNGEDDS